jgi:CDP-diacylglycerol--glycerol-3-phosphate 3-phosphatidyltransferase
MMAIYYGRGVAQGEPLEWQRWCAIAIFVLAAASDGLDGYIARRFNQRSQLGVLLDPIADKGLLLAGIIALSFSDWPYELPIWFAVLVIARDVIVVAGVIALQLLNGTVRVKPSWTGKVATVFQMIALSLVMLKMNLFSHAVVVGGWQFQLNFLDVPVYLAGLFTAISGVIYIIEGFRQLHAGAPADAKSTPPLKA